MSNFMFVAGVSGVLFLILLVAVISKLYRRASKELSFVRTGMGGQKVVVNGGALVLPVFHEIIPVNMNTLRLEVRRANEQALITRDRMRVDVQAEFYVRVKPTEEAIADAAQTLGKKTLTPLDLKDLIEAKFVDALRAVAAEMAMQELHEQRVDFVQKVQTVVSEDLLKNGLELESVSLTSLDQTNRDHFNPNNAFDAEGLTRLTEEIETRRKVRNDIEQDTMVAIQMKNLEAERQKLDLSRDEEYARLEQEQEVEVRRAAQKAEIAREQAIKDREARQARIAAEQEVERSEILAKRAVDEERIGSEQKVQERDIVKGRTLETAEIEKKKTVELSEQDREIAIAEKSKELSESQAEADKARALAAKAQEQVTTARETEKAERAKAIELVQAAKEAERDAIGIKVAAEAERDAAQSLAAAARTEAEGEADKVRITAEGEAEAEVRRAEAAAKRYEVDAEGQRALHEAENVLSSEIVAMRVKLALLEKIEGMIRESVKPMEAIDGIKIVQLGGMETFGAPQGHGGNGAGGDSTGASGSSLSDQVVSSALRYRAQAPLLDSLLKEVGLSGGSLEDLTKALDELAAPPVNGPAPKPPKPPEPSRKGNGRPEEESGG